MPPGSSWRAAAAHLPSWVPIDSIFQMRKSQEVPGWKNNNSSSYNRKFNGGGLGGPPLGRLGLKDFSHNIELLFSFVKVKMANTNNLIIPLLLLGFVHLSWSRSKLGTTHFTNYKGGRIMSNFAYIEVQVLRCFLDACTRLYMSLCRSVRRSEITSLF